jgi:hypothetical protein
VYLMKVIPIFRLWGTWWRLFQSFDFERTWWRLFQSFDFECTRWRLFQSFNFERTWWRLFQSFDFEVPDEGYSNLSTLSVPDEGYSRNVLYALNKISMLLLHTEVKHIFSLYASGISEFLNWKHCVLTSTTHHTIYINGLHVYVDLTVCWTIFFWFKFLCKIKAKIPNWEKSTKSITIWINL